MKKMKILKVAFLFVVFTCLCMIIISCESQPSWVPGERKRRFKEQVGTYVFDLKQTTRGFFAHQDTVYFKNLMFKFGPYAKDSELYRNLTITFKADSTFYFNMSVPFIFDSFGVWETSSGNPDIDGYNLMFFNTIDKRFCDNEYHPEGEQFDQVLQDSEFGPDSIFAFTEITPKNGNTPVIDLFFKKIK